MTICTLSVLNYEMLIREIKSARCAYSSHLGGMIRKMHIGFVGVGLE